jgi:hypothetical protein
MKFITAVTSADDSTEVRQGWLLQEPKYDEAGDFYGVMVGQSGTLYRIFGPFTEVTEAPDFGISGPALVTIGKFVSDNPDCVAARPEFADNFADGIARSALRLLNEALRSALHDAINRPKGVVPASAEPFYNPDRYGSADHCSHRWIDVRNANIVSGEYCPKCQTLRAASHE